jgi:hypothetical protein
MNTATPLPDRLSWNAIQTSYDADLAEHLRRAQSLGLDCPDDVFEQLFHDAHQDNQLAELLRFVDWRAVTWEERELSGVALRRVGVPRPFERAVDEARQRTAEEGFSDERQEVMVHWMQEHTWIRPPVLIAGGVLQSLVEYELFVGFTRLGNLLGALDRQDLPEYSRHRVWIGRAT